MLVFRSFGGNSALSMWNVNPNPSVGHDQTIFLRKKRWISWLLRKVLQFQIWISANTIWACHAHGIFAGATDLFRRDRIQVDFASNNMSITQKRSKGASDPHLSPILIIAGELSNCHRAGSTEQLKGGEADEPCELTVKSGDGLLHGRCQQNVWSWCSWRPELGWDIVSGGPHVLIQWHHDTFTHILRKEGAPSTRPASSATSHPGTVSFSFPRVESLLGSPLMHCLLFLPTSLWIWCQVLIECSAHKIN